MKSLANGTKRTVPKENPNDPQQQALPPLQPHANPLRPVRNLPDREGLTELKAHYEQAVNPNKKRKLTARQEEGEKVVRDRQLTQNAPQYRTILHVPVSSLKIGKAKGRRNPAHAPGKVLNMSAPDVRTSTFIRSLTNFG